MTSVGPLRRFQRLESGRRRLLLRALVTLGRAWAAVKMLPFRRAMRFGAVPLGGGALLSEEDCVWAVEAAARRVPWRAMCIEKGLAVQRLLRSAGVDARLHYGARHAPGTGDLEAHVWVTVDRRIVIGGEEAPAFAEIAVFP